MVATRTHPPRSLDRAAQLLLTGPPSHFPQWQLSALEHPTEIVEMCIIVVGYNCPETNVLYHHDLPHHYHSWQRARERARKTNRLTGAKLGTSGNRDRRGASFKPTSSTPGCAVPTNGAAIAADTALPNMRQAIVSFSHVQLLILSIKNFDC